MNDRDIRQLERMHRALDAFLASEITLRDLVATLSFLYANLDDVSDKWRHPFMDSWADLEVIVAYTKIEQRKLSDDEYTLAIDKAKSIKVLVTQLLTT